MEVKVRLVSPLERALYLKKLEPLQDLSPAELALIAQHAEEQFFKKGEVIFEKGERLSRFHIVVEGGVRATGGEHGGEIVGPEGTVGLLSLLAEAEEGLDAVADADTTTLAMNADDMNDVLEDHFSILLNEMRAIARLTLEERMKIPDGTFLAPAEDMIKDFSGRELDLVERLLFLQRGAAFDHPNMDALVQIVRLSREVGIPKGTALWESGDPSGQTYFIVTGTVRCALKDGRAFRLGSGYPMGNLESLSGHPRWYKPVMESNVLAMKMETDAFLDVIEDHFGLAKDLLGRSARGLIRILEQKRKPMEKDSAA